MINIKSAKEFALMRKAGEVVRDVLAELEKNIASGITTKELDRIAESFILARHATPSFKGYHGFPASICASPETEIVHGIPSNRKLEEGEIISIDVGAILDGWHGDAARTFAVGIISPEKERLIKITRESFFKGIEVIREGARIGDIAHTIQSYVESHGYSVVRELVGHGIGKSMHEEPNIPNFGSAGTGARIMNGMAMAIEPMVNMGDAAVKFYPDGWTVKTKDGKPSAHYENTVILENGKVEILTL